MFDKVYMLAEGECVYQGSVRNIVPYLKEIGPTCPVTYNPADFSKFLNLSFLFSYNK